VIDDTALINRVNWEDVKRNAVSSLVGYMARHEGKHQGDLLALIEAVLQMEDFSHLEKLEDGPRKASEARSAVAGLKKHAGTYSKLQEEKRRAAQQRERRLRQEEASRGVSERLAELKSQYFEIVSQAPQPRGYSLEKFLPEVFRTFDIDSKGSFKLVGEQIDGAFTFDGLDWLFECKWQSDLVGSADLDAFGGKISRKLDNTLGLFLSINGYSPGGITAYSKGRSVMILMDGADLMATVDGRIPLDQLIRRKRAHAAQKGEIYLPVQMMLS